MDYDKIAEESDRLNEARDCAVRAVAIVGGKSYSEVHSMFLECGRRPGDGTPFEMTKRVLKRLGLKIRRIDKPAKTVLTLERVLQAGRFLVRVRNHILAAVDGKVIDWTSGRQLRVKEFYEVTND